MNREQTKAILAQLDVFWPREEAPEQIELEVNGWTWAFENDSYETVLEGIKLWIKGGKPFMPKPSDIRHIIARTTILTHTPEEGWQIAITALRRFGPNLDQPYTYIDPDTNLAAQRTPSPLPVVIDRAVRQCGGKFLLEADADKARTAFIFAMKHIQEQEVDRRVFGNDPISLSGPLDSRPQLPAEGADSGRLGQLLSGSGLPDQKRKRRSRSDG